MHIGFVLPSAHERDAVRDCPDRPKPTPSQLRDRPGTRFVLRDQRLRAKHLFRRPSMLARCLHRTSHARTARFHEEHLMNWDRIEGNWKKLKGKVKEQWGELTDDDLDVIAGKKDQLSGRLQETYGIGKDEAD